MASASELTMYASAPRSSISSARFRDDELITVTWWPILRHLHAHVAHAAETQDAAAEAPGRQPEVLQRAVHRHARAQQQRRLLPAPDLQGSAPRTCTPMKEELPRLNLLTRSGIG